MYISGLGYYKAWINNVLVDDHELGQFVTFQQRTLYDVIDITNLLNSGCNILGVQLGNGWFNQPSIKAGPRQLRVLLSITNGDGSQSYYASSLTPSASTGGSIPLTFLVTQGPVLEDDIYVGEVYDGRIAQALSGWSTCGYKPGSNTTWTPALQPSLSPLTFNAVISTNSVPIRTDRTYSVEADGITQPLPGVFVYDFGQNMAGQTELYVEDCPVGTNITLLHAEILYPSGTVHNNYLPNAPMKSTYFCTGAASEGHRTYFSYFGFRYVQIEGFPGVPGENTLTAHFIHSDLPQAGEFSSSIPLLNQVQHATRYASLSNLQNIPTDCPQRERRGWLGDAQLSFNTVIHNFDGGAFYTKWLNDFIDSQVYNNLTMKTNGSLADCIPFYGHGHAIADSGWGAAGWVIPDAFSDMYADDVFDVYWYPHLRWYMEYWIASANNNNGVLPIFYWGDWANYYPGPYAFKTDEYPQVWYVLALDTTAKFANRLGYTADAQRYTSIAQQARAIYISKYYNASNGCFASCTYVSQIFAIVSNLFPQGSAEELQIWEQAMKWFNGTLNSEYTDLFGGGIISLKLLYSIIDRFNQTGLGLKFQIQNQIPSFGFWIETGGATTLWEQWNMDSINGGASRNHIMFGGSGSWYYSTLAGLSRVDHSRSWQNLVLAPPKGQALLDVAAQNLTYAAASIDSPMGLVSISWNLISSPATAGTICGEVPEHDILTLKCPSINGGNQATFTSVDFASFGAPLGTCADGFSINATCNAPTSVQVVQKLCIGKSTCSIMANVTEFGGVDPCFDVLKRLSVQLKGPCAVTLYTLSVTIPVGSTASVQIPTVEDASTVTIQETDNNIWTNNAFVPGVAGITAGAAMPGNTGIAFTVGSGTYSFAVIS